MVGNIEYILSHEKVLGNIILYMQKCDRKKAIPRTPPGARPKMNTLHSMRTCRCSHVTTLKLKSAVWCESGGIQDGQTAQATEGQGFWMSQGPNPSHELVQHTSNTLIACDDR